MLIPLLIISLRFKYISIELIPVAILLLISILVESINFAFVINSKNNFLILRVYTVFEVFLLLSFYFLFYNYKKLGNYAVCFILLLVSEYVDYKINGLSSFDNYSTSFESILFSSIALWSFYHLSKNQDYINPINYPFFWMNSSILIYFGGNFVLFVFNNYLLQHQSSGHLAIWGIHSCLNILYNCLIAVAFWKTKRP